MNMLYLPVEETKIVRLVGGTCQRILRARLNGKARLECNEIMSIKDTAFDGCRFSMKTNFKDQRSLPPLGDTLT